MRLSIILATYNNQSNVIRFVDSLKCIEFDYELIVVDGFSKDLTTEFIERNCPGAIILSREPRGIYDAYNQGMKHALGEYLLFIGADDSIESGINKLYDDILACGSALPVIICQSILLPINACTIHRDNEFNLIATNFCHQSILYKKDCVRNLEYDTDYHVMADWLFNLRLMRKYGKWFAYKNYVISSYTLGGYSGRALDYKWEVTHYIHKIVNIGFFILCKYVYKKKIPKALSRMFRHTLS